MADSDTHLLTDWKVEESTLSISSDTVPILKPGDVTPATSSGGFNQGLN